MKDHLDQPAPAPASATAESDDFRDHLATADSSGRRRWLYPKKPAGNFYRYRTWVSWLLLAILFVGPFVKIHDHPLLMVNIVERRFSILGQIFWPQDTVIFAVAMLLFLTSIIVFTSAFGRLWCGWTCPQTLLMELVFRKLEYWIDGDAPQQRRLARSPWTKQKILKRAAKHSLFLALSFVIGNTLLSYIIGIDALQAIITDHPRHHITGFSFMILFTLVFYSIFARFREQACTFICPYGRLQSAIVDENTLVVAYDYKRGENRAHWPKGQSHQDRRARQLGDCIDCRQCVAVCPTGIDIRNGPQMECVNCTACIDACDAIMDKIQRPRGLVRFASMNSIERGAPFRITARMVSYTALLLALTVVLLVLIFTRSDVESVMLRAPGSLFQTTADGNIGNLYILKVLNKSSRDLPIHLQIDNHPATARLMGGGQFVVPKEQLAQTSVLVELDPKLLTTPKTQLKVGIFSGERRLETLTTTFVGPRHH